MTAAPVPPERSGAEPRSALEAVASLSFLLFVATLPWSIAAMSIALAPCAALTLIVWVLQRWDWRRQAPFFWPIIGWLLALMVAAWFAEDRAASLPRIGKGFLPLLAWVAAYHARRPRIGRMAIKIWLGSAAVAAVSGLVLWLLGHLFNSERARGPTGHYMTFGGQLLLWLPVACAVALLAKPWRWRLAALAAAVVGLPTLAATFTRSAWIGTAVAIAVVVAAAKRRWLPALVIALGLTIVVAPARYRERLFSAFDPSHVTNVEREHMWEAGGRMFRDHPLTGVGLMDLHTIYERYRDPQAHEGAGHLHSVFVQIAATMGIVGLVAFAFLYGSLFRAAISGLKLQLAAGGLAAALRLGVAAALVAFLLAGFFEWNFGDEELLDQLYTMVGLAWAARAWPGDDDEASRASGGSEGGA